MSKVRVHPAENVEWVTLRSLYPADLAAERSDAELDSTMAYHEQGTAGSLHLTEYNYLPHAKFDLHAHDQPRSSTFSRERCSSGRANWDAVPRSLSPITRSMSSPRGPRVYGCWSSCRTDE